MINSLPLNNLVGMLKLRKRQSSTPYNLLLASTISLTPDVIRLICGSESWTRFYRYLQTLGAASDDLINLLTEHIGTHNNDDGYRILAHLVKAGYFPTVLTTNTDSMLEDLLLEIGLPPAMLQTFIVGRDKDEYIARALGESSTGIRIIKLHGSLRERVLPTQFPDFFDAPTRLRENLGKYLNQDIVIVGSIERDRDIMRVVNAYKKSQIYYVVPRKSLHDDMISLIEARGNNSTNSVISGYTGEFTTFFKLLEEMLLLETPFQETVLPSSEQMIEKQAERDIPGKRTLVADVLLVTVTEFEARAVLQEFPENEWLSIGERVYYNLGVIGDARTFMVQSEMGSDGPGGSRFTTEEGIQALSPSVIIAVGIAFGIDKEKQHIGDILVSRQLVPYDYQRIGIDHTGAPTIYLRNGRVSVPLWLLDRLKACLKTWQEPPQVHSGLILSGSKLIDNKEYRDQLLRSAGEVIGGEMEGVGLYETAQRHNVGWLVIKAISDWADGNKHLDKEKCQAEAALNAARFTIHIIQEGDFRNSPTAR